MHKIINVDLILATRNRNKVREITDILAAETGDTFCGAGRHIRILTLSDIFGEKNIEIPECGSTFDENALLKARFVKSLISNTDMNTAVTTPSETKIINSMALAKEPTDKKLSANYSSVIPLHNAIIAADDSGLCVDFLGGAPGVFSARYAGENATDDERVDKLLNELADVPAGPNRSARFCCSIAMIYPDGDEMAVSGVCEGWIATSRAGTNGFAYDPIFYLPEMSCTYAQLSPEEKNAVSHRGKAIRLMYKSIASWRSG